MPGFGEILIIALVVCALLSYRRLPDAARSLGRSLRVFRAETRGLREDDVRGKAEPASARGPLGDPTRPDAVTPDADRPNGTSG
jgi:sec-independent protein translocase protein TatA